MNMNILRLIFDINTGIWAIVPIRQYKTKYFYFFLAWASADIITTLFLRHIFHSTSNALFAPCAFLAFISLVDKNSLKKYWILITIIFIGTFFVTINHSLAVLTVTFIHLLILGVILKNFVIKILEKNVFDIFEFVFVFYEITLVAMYINYLTGFTDDYHYFIITGAFQIFFAIYFIIFKADTKRVLFQLK